MTVVTVTRMALTYIGSSLQTSHIVLAHRNVHKKYR